MDAQAWDERYRTRDQLFSGAPNGVLVTEAAGLTPGQALDVGCGEGGDARWLARRGWQVTAIDFAETALHRAAAATTDEGGRISWVRADLTVTAPPAGAFDLVSVQYFPLERQPGDTALRGLIDAVAPGGTLLIGGHVHNFDEYYQPAEIAELLGDDWTVVINETRARTVPSDLHTHDTVLRAMLT